MDDPKSAPYLTRRGFLELGAAATAAGLLQGPNRAAAAPATSPRKLASGHT